MNKISTILVLVLLITINLSAQELTLKLGQNDLFTSQNTERNEGTIYIVQDAALNNLINKNASLSKEVTHTPGFRIQVYFSSDRAARQEAERIKKDLKTKYSNLAVYIEYKAPFWKVKLGNYKTRNEALRMKNELTGSFPNLWIIKEMVKINSEVLDDEIKIVNDEE